MRRRPRSPPDPSTGQLLREHLRTQRGWHPIADDDPPTRIPPKTLALLAAAKRAGPAISTVRDHIHRYEGAAGVRRILGVLSLVTKHGSAGVENAATGAPELGVPTYPFLKRYLDRHPVAPLSSRQVDPLIPELTVYRALVDRRPEVFVLRPVDLVQLQPPDARGSSADRMPRSSPPSARRRSASRSCR